MHESDLMKKKADISQHKELFTKTMVDDETCK